MLSLLRQTLAEWQEDKVPVLAAALSYYTVFSLAPLLIIVIGVLGLFFGQGQAQAQLMGELRALLGPDVAQTLQTMIENRNQAGGNLFATFIGVSILFVGATGVFVQLQNALNTIWQVEASPKTNGFLRLIRVRLLSAGMVLGIGFLLLVSLVISAAISALSSLLSSAVPGGTLLWQVVNFSVSFFMISLLFALMFKYVPDAVIAWQDVWVGAALTALLFVIGKFFIGLYLGQSGVASSYGAAGSLVVLLLWVFYSAQIVLFGGEFIQVYAKRRGSSVKPAQGAVLRT